MMTCSRALVVVVLAAAALTRPAAADPAFSCHPASPQTKLRADFAQSVSLRDLTAWLVGFSCKNVVFTSEVAQNATRIHVVAPNDMTPKQAVQLYLDAIDATGLVATDKGDTIVIKPGPNMPQSCPDITQSPPLSAPANPNDEVAANTTIVDATHATITQALVDKLVADPSQLIKSTRIVPAMQNGKPTGLKLYAIRQGSVPARFNFENGDTLVAVNGVALGDATAALDVLKNALTATSWQFDIIRRGAAMSLFVTVK
jgi:type II secretory pathway component PulC